MRLNAVRAWAMSASINFTWRSLLPAWRLAWGWARAALSGHRSLSIKARALLWVARRTYWKRVRLGRDLLDVLRFRHH